MPSFTGLFGSAQSGYASQRILQRQFESALTTEGTFGAGLPVSSPYIWTDPDTTERVHLWRLPEDEERHARYVKYRHILRKGMKAALQEAEPELFHVSNREQNPPPVRVLEMLPLLSSTYSATVNGGGIDISTGFPDLDTALEEQIELPRRLRQATYEASVYDMVGLEIAYDDTNETFSVRRVQPDFLYVERDPLKGDEICCVCKRIPMTLDAVPGWNRLTAEFATNHGMREDSNFHGLPYATGSNNVRPNKDKDDKTSYSATQDGWVYEERHYRGWIEYSLYATVGSRVISQVPLGVWNPDLAKTGVQITGMPDFALLPYQNSGNDSEPRSDWDRAYDLVLAMCSRFTKSGRAIDKYLEPHLVVSARSVSINPQTGKSNFQLDPSEAIVVRPEDPITPSLLQANPNFSAPESDFKQLAQMLGIISNARHVVDPDVADQIPSGAALKLKMAPTKLMVQDRREQQEKVAKRLVRNLLAGLEYRTSNRESGEEVGDDVPFKGDLYGLVSDVLSGDKESESYKLASAIFDAVNGGSNSEGERIQISKFSNVTPHADTPDPSLGREPDTPDPISTDNIQKAGDAAAISGAMSAKALAVRFRGADPQDDIEARNDVVNGVMSLERFLRERGLDEDEIKEEIALIEGKQNAEAERMAFNDPIGVGGFDQGVENVQTILDGGSEVDSILESPSGIEGVGTGTNSTQETGLGQSLAGPIL